eukprot:CAMPEP_0116059626 /NCGR_PEP_ID=MMETSP0322-20121206/5908_1 /TAXON_ID=163516 /ORGANISM="Leptocylindrus danicus var. apora, Strain B651" /LENGTH=367 /DNA_ID=CAMNT_0003544043 /DNA_START=111 /DNA_END=1211 /DNA_ORIENTATION=+
MAAFIPPSSSSTAFQTHPSSSLLYASSIHKRPPPVFGSDLVYPAKVILNGLKDAQPCRAAYVILSKDYQRGDKDLAAQWSHAVYVGSAVDLYEAVSAHTAEFGDDVVAHVRAQSFAPSVVEDEVVAKVEEWQCLAKDFGATLSDGVWVSSMPIEGSVGRKKLSMEEARAYLVEEDDMDDYDDDDDDDDDDEWEDELISKSVDEVFVKSDTTDEIVSPFSNDASSTSETNVASKERKVKKQLEFNAENVDTVLNEIRPYLISDGGNVSVKDIESTQEIGGSINKVYLQLEGACGSCPSSTVTMKMGIERVLNENFSNVEVIQVDSENDGGEIPTIEYVQNEVNRLLPAITALGGVVKVIDVTELGVVT